MTPSRVRVYIACSLDGFIAGVDDDLSWLPGTPDGPQDAALQSPPAPGVVDYATFIADVGALLMGRGTFDAVSGMDMAWPYGELPVLVATHRPLEVPPPQVRAVAGEIGEMIETARRAAGGKDVYLDGGVLIRQALDAGLVDEMIVTMVPVVLGRGHALFAGAERRHRLEFTAVHRYGSMVQLTARPATRA